MARINNDIQQDEVRAYEKFCIAHNILLGGGHDDVASIENANLVRDYFTKTWNEVITAETLERALPALRPHLKFKSTARLEFEKAMTAEPDRARQLDQWLKAHGGKPGQLVNTVISDDTFENLSLLLGTLGGYEISTARIQDAENRIQSKPGRKLHYVEAPRRTEPVSRAAKDSPGTDSTNWLGDMVKTPDGSYRSKNVHEQRRAREAAEAAKAQPQTSSLDPSEASWKAMADDLLRDGTHSQQARVREVYDRELGQGSFRRVYEACKKEVNAYKNRNWR